MVFNFVLHNLNKAPPPSETLLTGNDSRFGPGNSGAEFVQANAAHSGTDATVDMVETSNVSHRPNTNGLIMYSSNIYGGSDTPKWGYLTNLLDTGFTLNYTGKWSDGSTQNIVFEFGSNFTFTKVVWKERSYSGYDDPILNNIKYWNGSAYQQVTTTQTTSPPTGPNREHTYTISTLHSSRYIRMEFSSTSTTYLTIGEIEVYGY